jgi:hypothetical protein
MRGKENLHESLSIVLCAILTVNNVWSILMGRCYAIFLSYSLIYWYYFNIFVLQFQCLYFSIFTYTFYCLLRINETHFQTYRSLFHPHLPKGY